MPGKKDKDKLTADIWLPYYKQGDDMHGGIVMKDGKLDVKQTFQNHIDRLTAAIEQLTKIKDMIPDDVDVDIHADTHHIDITSDKFTIQRLVDSGLASLPDYDDISEPEDELDGEGDENDEGDEGDECDEDKEIVDK
jgi:hypothetical protein